MAGRGVRPIPWYKRSAMAPVWVTLVLAVIFGGLLIAMRFDLERRGTASLIAHQTAPAEPSNR